MIDLNRLCESREEMPLPDPQDIWGVVKAVIRICDDFSAEHGDICPESDERMRTLRSDTLSMAFKRELGDLSYAIAMLMRSPRTLKSALRRTWAVWQRLHGEVFFDDLLVFNVVYSLRKSLLDRLSAIRSAIVSQPLVIGKRSPTPAATDLSDVLSDLPREAQDYFRILLEALMPETDEGRKGAGAIQGVALTRYWNRVVAGEVEDGGVRDQRILADMKAYKESGDPTELAKHLLSDQEYTDAFEYLAGRVRGQELSLLGEAEEPKVFLQLVSHFFSALLNAQKVQITSESSPGFITLWRLVKRIGGSPEDYAAWLWHEMETAMPLSLRFAFELYHYWGSTQYTPIGDKLRYGQIRKGMYDWSRENFTVQYLHSNLTHCPWVLYWWVFQPEGASKMDESEVSKQGWGWLGLKLVEGARTAPDAFLPAICALLSETTGMIPTERSIRTGRFRKYAVQSSRLELFLPDGDARLHFVEEILAQADQMGTLDSESRQVVEDTIPDLKEWLAANRKRGN